MMISFVMKMMRTVKAGILAMRAMVAQSPLGSGGGLMKYVGERTKECGESCVDLSSMF